MAYQRQSPDYTQLVEHLAKKYPKEWDLANKGKYGERTDHFIRIFAFEANKIDFRIGLNGKRGDPNNISRDAIAYKNNTVPSENGGCEVIDIIVGSSHTPTWQDVTLPHVAGAWVFPYDPKIPVDDLPETDGPIDNTDYQSQIDELKQMIARLKLESIQSGDVITLRSQPWDVYPAQFVCADKNQGSRLIANRDSGDGPWEKFTIGKD